MLVNQSINQAITNNHSHLIIFLLCCFLATPVMGAHASQRKFFDKIYRALENSQHSKNIEVIEIPYESWLGLRSSRPYVIETGRPEVHHSMEDLQVVPVAAFDFYELHNPKSLSYLYKASRMDNFMVCYKKRKISHKEGSHKDSGFKFCYIFPQPIDFVIEKIEATSQKG